MCLSWAGCSRRSFRSGRGSRSNRCRLPAQTTRSIGLDLDSRNLLVEEGRLSAVIDWGGLGVGDPACDVMVAWKVLSADTRDIFRTAISVDESTWARARGWALSRALIVLPYDTLETNPVLVREAHRWLAEVLADHA